MEAVGWGNTPTEPSFGGGQGDAASVKGKLVNLISSVRTLMRSKSAMVSIHTFSTEGPLLRREKPSVIKGYRMRGRHSMDPLK